MVLSKAISQKISIGPTVFLVSDGRRKNKLRNELNRGIMYGILDFGSRKCYNRLIMEVYGKMLGVSGFVEP